ncbi:uncharacterized protein [Lolium perenne]|uniref:uncharacterized protein isoform X3 n=1 Tax=Lolium perenne TaxID=4522 RepID=UPI003A9923FD
MSLYLNPLPHKFHLGLFVTLNPILIKFLYVSIILLSFIFLRYWSTGFRFLLLRPRMNVIDFSIIFRRHFSTGFRFLLLRPRLNVVDFSIIFWRTPRSRTGPCIHAMHHKYWTCKII